MIIWKGYGDLLADRAVKLIPCNAAGAMGAGLAREVRDRWPEVYEVYRSFYAPGVSPVASIRERARIVTPVTANDGQRFLLVCSKYHWRQDSDEALIRDNLATIDDMWRSWQIPELAMPLLGSGLGHLGRTHIEQVIREILGESKLPIKLYMGIAFPRQS
jgi:hypothetical protein